MSTTPAKAQLAPHRLGHESAQTTANAYGPLLPSAEQQRPGRTIMTAAELDALPDDVLIRASGRYVANGGFAECWARPIPESITGGGRRLWQVLVFGEELLVTTADRMTYPVEVLYAPAEPVATTARYVEAQPDSGPYKPAMPAHWVIEQGSRVVARVPVATTVDREDIAAVDNSMHNGSEMTHGNMAWGRIKAALLPATVKPDREALARALFESIDVEALAHVLAVHAYATNHRGFDQDCKCGAGRGTRRTLERGTEWHRRHQAEAVKAYLLGGTRIAREGGRTDG